MNEIKTAGVIGLGAVGGPFAGTMFWCWRTAAGWTATAGRA